MKLHDALKGVRRLYLEAAPLIYYVEENPTYIAWMDTIIGYLEETPAEAVSSVILLTEVLNQPIKLGKIEIERAYRNILLNNRLFRMTPVTAEIAEKAAQLRAQYNLRTPYISPEANLGNVNINRYKNKLITRSNV